LANTTFNPSDKSAGITLTGSNLIATNNNGSASGVRAVDRQVTGKFYWECTLNVIVSASTAVGIVSPYDALTASPSNAGLNTSGVIKNGNTYVNGVSAAINIGALANGSVVCVAVDCAARLVWYRLGAAGNWNASASNNPATGVGGISISLGQGIPIYPGAWPFSLNDQITANFGDTAFVGAVPSGYTSGFTALSADTVLLVHADGTNGSTTFTDASLIGHPLVTSATGASVSTTTQKFGSGSLALTGAGFVKVTGTTNFQFGSAPFTIECWAYLSSAPSIAGLVTEYSAGDGYFFGTIFGNLAFWYIDGASALVQFASTTAPTTGVWHHYAADRDAGGTLRIYIDGVVVASTSAPTFANSIQPVNIGNDNGTGRTWPGYIDEVRVTKGIARYGGAFTPPSAPFVSEPNPFPTNAIASQALAEHWLTTDPDARITQVVAEHWASVASGNLQAVVTFVALEHWTSVAVVVPAAGGPIVTMIH